VRPDSGFLLRPTLFLDRDGVLNVDHGYVHRWEDFDWIPGAREAVRRFNAAGWLVIVITMQEALAEAGARIDAFYYCPQHPEAADEAYRHPDPPDRKPNPGMLLRALSEWPVDRDRAVMIGDKPADIEAALRAGIKGLLFEGGDLDQFLKDAAVLD
jgi:D-glycero-D-manno-heptose 1,7-bisphosphate phosphatase